MLVSAGTSFAVAVTHPTVREAADRVVPGPADDGVATVLAEAFGLAGGETGWPGPRRVC